MSRSTKIVIGIAVAVVVVCCMGVALTAVLLPRMAASFAEQAVIENPAVAAEVASSMLDYELPAGFTAEGGVSFLGFKTVFIASEKEGSVIMLMQFPSGMAGDEAQMRQQMEDAFSQRSDSQASDLTFIGSEALTINDAPAAFTIYEGKDESGNQIRQVIGVFETKDGNTGMMMLMGTVEDGRAGFEPFWESLK